MGTAPLCPPGGEAQAQVARTRLEPHVIPRTHPRWCPASRARDPPRVRGPRPFATGPPRGRLPAALFISRENPLEEEYERVATEPTCFSRRIAAVCRDV